MRTTAGCQAISIRIEMKIVETPPAGAVTFRGSFCDQPGADMELVCGQCGWHIMNWPSSFKLGRRGAPVIIVCESCEANNVAP